MKHQITGYSLIVGLIGMSVLIATQAQAQTNGTEQARQVSVIQDLKPIGLAFGQSLRISVFNPLAPAPPGADGRKFKMLVAPLIVGATGNVLTQSDEITIEPGEFHSFEFKRDGLPLAGEPGTGRVEVRARIRYRSFFIVDRTQLAPPSLEIVDDSTGRTTGAFSAINIGIGDLNGTSTDPSAAVQSPGYFPSRLIVREDPMLGIIPGQTLRATVFNPTQGTTIKGHVRIFDNSGIPIGQSAELLIPPGEFRSFDFDRITLSRDGEAGTGRLQLRATLTVKISEEDSRDSVLLLAGGSVEVIDNLTGRTEPAALHIGVIQVLRCSRGSNGEEVCRIVSVPVPIP